MKDDYELSRSGLYLRLLPGCGDIEEGKIHIKTIPIKIRHAKNNFRKKHPDANFTFATKEYLKNIVSIFRPDSVLVLSTDDKSQVLIEITAATKEALMVTRMTP